MNRLNNLEKRLAKLEKYLLESKADQEKLLNFLGDEYYNKFNLIKNKIKDPEYKDIYKLIKKDPNEVKEFIDSFQSKRDIRQTSKEGAKLLYNKDGWKVYRITTYEAATFYGRNTKWCITGNYPGHEDRGENYFNDYITDYDLDGGYYFYIKSNDEKYCILKQNNGAIHSIWNIEDEQINFLDLPDDFPSIPSIYDEDSVKVNSLLFSSNINNVRKGIELAKKLNINIDDLMNDMYRTPLVNAYENDETEIFGLLLNNGANPNINYESDPFIIKVCKKGQLEFAKLLYKAGATFGNIKDYDYGYNIDILSNAIDHNYTKMVQWLISIGYDVNTRYKGDMYTPLIRAIKSQNLEIVKLLLDNGVDTNAVDQYGFTPITSAVASRKNNIDIVKLLINKGIDVTKLDANGRTALHYAVRNGNENIVELLLVNGADRNINTKDDYGLTPIEYAEKYKNEEIIELLKSYM